MACDWPRAPARTPGRPVNPQGAQELVRLDRGVAQHLGQPARADAALHLHLPQAVLRMDIAQRKEGVVIGFPGDVRHAVVVAQISTAPLNPATVTFPLTCGSDRRSQSQPASGVMRITISRTIRTT